MWQHFADFANCGEFHHILPRRRAPVAVTARAALCAGLSPSTSARTRRRFAGWASWLDLTHRDEEGLFARLLWSSSLISGADWQLPQISVSNFGFPQVLPQFDANLFFNCITHPRLFKNIVYWTIFFRNLQASPEIHSLIFFRFFGEETRSLTSCSSMT